MSQFGMQMPSGQLQRGPTMNVYTGLLLLAVLALLAAIVFLAAFAGPKIGPEGSPFGIHKYDESTKAYEIKLAPEK